MNPRSQSNVSEAREAIARAWADRRDASARAVYQRGIAAEKRAVDVLSQEARDLVRNVHVSPDLARALVSIGAAEIVSSAGESATGACKAATAAKVTATLRADDAPACAYALDRDVTGSLYAPRMRVRPSGSKRTGGAANAAREATPRAYPTADAMTSAREGACAKACHDLTLAFQARARATGATRKAATSQIRAIVSAFQGDHAIAAICRAHDWTIIA